MTPTNDRATLNKTLFESNRFQARFLVLQAKTRGRRTSQSVVHDSPPPEQQECVSLPIASFANTADQTEPLSDTSVCRQLHHRRLRPLEFPLQVTILPHVSDDSSARISETCLILFFLQQLDVFDEDQMSSLPSAVWSSGPPSICVRNHHWRMMNGTVSGVLAHTVAFRAFLFTSKIVSVGVRCLPQLWQPTAPTERCSDDEDPFGHGGALDAEEESAASTQRQGNEHESPEEHFVNKLVLGSGVVHHSHETRLLRGITFCGKCGAWSTSAPRLLTKACTNQTQKRLHLS